MSRKSKKPPITIGRKKYPFSCPYQKQCEKKRVGWFSKIILSAIMLTYFIGFAYAIYAVNKILMEYPEWAIQALIALFGYIGAPTATAIAFYSWKAKNENTKKIEQSGGQIDASEDDSGYSNTYTVDTLNGDRAVLDSRGICTPFNVNDLILV